MSDRHIDPQGAKWVGKKSVFEFGSIGTKGQPSLTKGQKENIVLGMFQGAFEKGAANNLGGGIYAYSYAPYASLGGLSVDFIGRDARHNNEFTNVRTVLLRINNPNRDCGHPTLITGYPGLSSPGASVSGTPTWQSVDAVIR